MSDLNLFIPISKVDAQQRLVYGVATAEAEDRAGEICDYDSTKPLYEKWSQEIAQSSGGKSRGNLRAMPATWPPEGDGAQFQRQAQADRDLRQGRRRVRMEQSAGRSLHRLFAGWAPMPGAGRTMTA